VGALRCKVKNQGEGKYGPCADEGCGQMKCPETRLGCGSGFRLDCVCREGEIGTVYHVILEENQTEDHTKLEVLSL
jgi:hypothetical protein